MVLLFTEKGVEMRIYIHVLMLCFTMGWAGNAFAGLGIAGRVGSQGLGIEVTTSMIPAVNLRGGIYYLSGSFDVTKSDVKYNFDLKLKSLSLLLDFHPFPKVGFRLTGGVMFNGNKVDLAGEPQGTYEIGNQTYSGAQIGTLLGKMTFRSAAPYVGIGWGNATRSRLGFALDLGIAIQGAPDVTLSATGPIASDPSFQTELKREEQNIRDDVEIFKLYPVVSIGLSFKLGAL